MFFSFFFSECLSGNITAFVTPNVWGDATRFVRCRVFRDRIACVTKDD